MRQLHVWVRISSVVLLTMLLAIAAQAQSQDSPPPDLQQLKEKLQQLEQEMQVLKGQIGAVEQGKKSPGTAANPSPYSAAESQQAAAPPAEGTETAKRKSSLDLYGFVMVDSGYEFGQTDPNWFDVMRPTKLPASANQFGGNGNVYFSVRQTRFGVKTSTPTGWGDLKTQFEFELFGTGVDAGQTTFRLRHAYGELGQFGAGQTWSPFMDIDVFPNSVEYWGPNGMVFFRNVQIRWMPLRNDRNQITIAVERPGASADQGVYAGRIELQGVKPRFNFPDLSGHVRLIRDWGYLQMAGIIRKIGWVDTNNDALQLGGHAVGWGVNVTSNLKLGNKDVAKLAVLYGAGIENYMNDAPIDIGIKNNFGNPIAPIKGVALPVLGVVSFVDHTWNEHFTSSAGYSLLNIENSDAQSSSDFHQGHYALANLLYHPVPSVTIGSEFQFGRRVNFKDGFNVNDYRMQFSFKYDWAKGFAF
jgi:outer membrane DcaP-like protein